jgi:hypothetical protein
MVTEETYAALELFVRQRFGDLVSEAELELLRQPAGFAALKKILALRCKRPQGSGVRG